jgi:alcohol dehydrogenase (NADP+)
MYQTKAYATSDAKAPLAPTTIARRDVGARDVQLDVSFCGICHSDLHQVKNEFGATKFPIVPGHEIVGRVTKVGASVTRHKVGDLVAVGCLVDSDRTCDECKAGLEQFCPHQVIVFGSPDKHLGGHTLGGFSSSMVVDEHFVLRVPPKLDPAKAAPLLCAGITMYSPLRHWGVDKGKRVGIVGLGGLGHLGVKLAKALGAEVTVFTTSESKRKDALALGADDVVLSRDAAAMKTQAGRFDVIVDTVSAEHDVNPYLAALRRDGAVVIVGLPTKPFAPTSFGLVLGRKSLSGSNIGGIAETQELLDLCAERNITADVEVIPIQRVNEGFERLARADVKYRFVLDMSSLKA